MKKKGQITIFIILGIIIVIAFAFVFYLSRVEVTETKLESEILKDEIIRIYITSCLEKTSDDGLELIGMQGGVIYHYQISNEYKGGSILDDSFGDKFVITYDGYNVAYAVKKTTGLGISMLKPLCNKEGINKWNLSGYSYSCETYDIYPFRQNAQNYLEDYINEKIKDCVKEEDIKEMGYDVELGIPDSKVLIGEDDLKITLDYSVNIGVKGRKVSRLLDFSINPKIRLKKLHESASHLTGYHDLQSGENSGEVYENEFNIRSFSTEDLDINKEIIDGNSYFIIKLTDSKSIVNGKKYVFQFVIEDRDPFLDGVNCIDPDDKGREC